MANDTRITMGKMVSSCRSVSVVMDEIHAATAEQKHGIEEVSQSPSQLDQMTQQNAVLVEQAAAVAANLTQQARSLQSAVSSL